MSNNVKAIAIAIAGMVLIVGVGLGVYYIKRRINYSMGYKDMVEGTIREQVRPECLR